MSRLQFLAPESICSPSYEGLKVHVSQNTILVTRYTLCNPLGCSTVFEDRSPIINSILEYRLRELYPVRSCTVSFGICAAPAKL